MSRWDAQRARKRSDPQRPTCARSGCDQPAPGRLFCSEECRQVELHSHEASAAKAWAPEPGDADFEWARTMGLIGEKP